MDKLAKDAEFSCACRFKRREDFGDVTLIESCGYHSAREKSLQKDKAELVAALAEIANAGTQPNAWPADRARQALAKHKE